MLHDHRHFVGKAGVVAHTVGNGAGQHMAVAIFVLQTLAIECGATRSATQQEAARLHIARRPSQVSDALQTEHGVINVEGHHDAVAGAVRGGSRNPAAHTASFVDALLQNLTGFVLFVVHDLVFIHRGVQLPLWVVDTHLTEQTFHTKSTGLVHQNGHYPRAYMRVSQQDGQKTHIGLGGGNFAPFRGGLHHRFEHLEVRHLDLFIGFGAALGQIPTQRLAALVQIFHFRRVVCRLVKRNLIQLIVWNRNIETVSKGANVIACELFGLVSGVFALAALAHAKTFHGFDQQHRGLTLMVHRLVIGRIHLLWVVATALQTPNVFVAHVGHHFERFGVFAEKVLPHIGAVVGFKSLVVTVYGVHHQPAQVAFFVSRQQGFPVAAPQELDHVPARATKLAF